MASFRKNTRAKDTTQRVVHWVELPTPIRRRRGPEVKEGTIQGGGGQE